MDHGGRFGNYIDLTSSDEEYDEEFSMVESSESEFDNEDDARQQRKFTSHRFCASSASQSQDSLSAGRCVSYRFTDALEKYLQTNLALRLRQREYVGKLSLYKKPLPLLCSVPKRLSFCLKDMIYGNFMQGHIFMGLTACGQFLLSYKVCSADTGSNVSHYSFSMGYKYTLFFWIYQPHKPLCGFYKCLLFDDHGVDNVKCVSMMQWKNTDPRILIIHGASEEENEDSYITYVKVPKLGCLDCRKQRDSEEDEGGYFRRHILCIKCNLTVHTKYSTTESDCKFDPHLHLICPERILVVSNGFFHVIHINMEQPPKEQQQMRTVTSSPQQSAMSVIIVKPVMPGACSTNIFQDIHCSTPPVVFTSNTDNDNFSVDSQTTNNSQSNLVSRIIEDFPDIETDSTHSGSGIAMAAPHHVPASSLKSPTRYSLTADSQISQITTSRKSCEELLFACSPSTSFRVSAITSAVTTTGTSTSTAGTISKSNTLPQEGPRRRHRIVTKSFRKGVSIFFSSSGITTTNTIHNPSCSNGASTSSSTDRASAYEFCEENEKCEKISILRKRRLAERKYEFSEDNSENIIPFTKTRLSSTNSFRSFLNNSAAGSHSPRHSLTPLHNSLSPYVSPSSSPQAHSNNVSNSQYDVSRHYATPSTLSPLRHSCTSPLGFRSPPTSSGLSSNAGGGVMRSPSRLFMPNNFYSSNHKSPPQGTAHTFSPATQYMLSFKPNGTLSPLQLSITKRSHLEGSGSISPNHQHPFLSPRRDDIRSFEVPLHAGSMSEKPVCTKRFHRRYVEEDDAASVITSEEDDCISPGYHTLLPMEVHGSCYSEMQMISKASFQQLRCISVVIEQHSFDMETFTYYVISTLCQKNLKSYDFFYDWAYELIKVCPLSTTMFCLLMAHFSARDEVSACINCSRKLSCAFHLRQFECRVLFSWNMVSGEWNVLDFGELHDYKLHNIFARKAMKGRCPLTLSKRAKKLAREIANSLNKIPDHSDNLRVLESNINKSKKTISDVDNMIAFSLKRPSYSMS